MGIATSPIGKMSWIRSALPIASTRLKSGAAEETAFTGAELLASVTQANGSPRTTALMKIQIPSAYMTGAR